MNSLKPSFLENLRIQPQHSMVLAQLNEAKGKEFLYTHQIPEILDVLMQSAVRESIIASNLIEGIEVSDAIAQELLQGNKVPTERNELEFAGYQRVLRQIHESPMPIRFTQSNIKNFHKNLLDQIDANPGQYKHEDNVIGRKLGKQKAEILFSPTPAVDTPLQMEMLCKLMSEHEKNLGIDPLILIPLVVLDYLCIHPFADGNGRTARLWTLALLYAHGFNVGRYISIERIMEERRPFYYESLQKSSKGWHEGKHDVWPWLTFFWSCLKSAYHDFNARVESFGDRKTQKGAKTKLVQGFIDNAIGSWTISEVMQTFPGISEPLIKRVHQQLRKSGKIYVVQTGRTARWARVD